MPLIDTNHQRAALLVLLLGVALVIALTPYATGLIGIPVLYAVFTPVHEWLSLRVRPKLAASLVVALALFLIVVPGVSFAGLIVGQAQGIPGGPRLLAHRAPQRRVLGSSHDGVRHTSGRGQRPGVGARRPGADSGPPRPIRRAAGARRRRDRREPGLRHSTDGVPPLGEHSPARHAGRCARRRAVLRDPGAADRAARIVLLFRAGQDVPRRVPEHLDAQTHRRTAVNRFQGAGHRFQPPWHPRNTHSPPPTGNLRNPPGVGTNNFVHSETRWRSALRPTRSSRFCACCGSAVRAPYAMSTSPSTTPGRSATRRSSSCCRSWSRKAS